MELKGLKINFLGDSITEGAGVSTPENIYWNLIKSTYGAEVVRGYGIGGTRIARQKKPSAEPRWDRDFCSRFGEMDDDANVVVVFGGTNDYGHGDAKLGCFDDRDPYTFYGAFHQLISYLVATFPKNRLCFVLPIPRYGQDNPCGENGIKETPSAPLSAYIEAEKAVLSSCGVQYLDLSDRFYLPSSPTCSALFLDGLHPNEAGHRLIADGLIEYLEKVDIR